MKKCGCKCEIHDIEKPSVEWIPSPNFSERAKVPLDTIVVHYTASSNIEGVIDWFKRTSSKVSAHYVIGKDGRIVQMVDDSKKAWHAGKHNSRSIGIENVAKGDDRLTVEQKKSLVELLRHLCHTHDIHKENIKGHRYLDGASTDCPGHIFDPVEKNVVEKWVEKNV